ncbi:MAG: cation diffusion facilitator family transporter [Gemmatimonadaceae bacterium]
MNFGRRFVFPRKQWEERKKARKLAWISLAALVSTAILMYVTLGQSEAMKTAWVEDLLGMIPPIVLLIAMRLELREPNERFPYGYFRAVSVAFLVTAAVLALAGAWLLFDSTTRLVARERPPIGAMTLFGHQFWLGWAMIVALMYSVLAGVTLGIRKRPVAEKLHDKSLDADADMNRAGWMSEGAAIVGILLVGYGKWWGDAVAAGFISINIIRDGIRNLREVLADLMDETPTKLGGVETEDLPQRLARAAEKLDWVTKASVRLREQGHVLNGEVFVVPRSSKVAVKDVEDASRELTKMDWRIYSLTVMPVSSLEEGEVPKVGTAS